MIVILTVPSPRCSGPGVAARSVPWSRDGSRGGQLHLHPQDLAPACSGAWLGAGACSFTIRIKGRSSQAGRCQFRHAFPL